MHIDEYPIEINEFPYRLTATVRVISEETIMFSNDRNSKRRIYQKQ